MSRFVLDASTVLGWCFPDENVALAEHVAAMLKRGDTAVAPSFWPHEVLNALLAGERRKRISEGLVRAFLRDLAALPIELERDSAKAVFEQTQPLSRRYGLTAYDSAYLRLAIDHRLPLATLDEELIIACRKAGANLVTP